MLWRTAFVFLSLSTATARAAPPESSATMPLEELLRLHRELEQAQKPASKPPPVAANVDKLELSGRLFEDGIELGAHFEVSVLSDGAWVTLPLLRLDSRVSIAALPEVDGATLVKQGEHLVLVSKKAASYGFDISLRLEAQKDNRRRKVQLSYPGATLGLMRVQFDDALFRVVAPRGHRKPDGYVLYPIRNEFVMEWEQLVPIEAPAAAPKRPPVQPLIERGYASVVSTLEGKAIVRVLYDFRCERSQPLQLELPEAQKLKKVFLNGVSIPFAVRERVLQLNLEPARAGDQSGKLELVLAEQLGRYHLSGTLHVTVPRTEWPVNEMYLELHLPPVFQYKRVGGSMEEMESPPSVDFTQKIPTPGKQISFHQFLIASSAPEVDLAYDVELSGNYFH